MKRVRVAALLLSGLVSTATFMPSAAVGQAIPAYDENAGDALARNMRTLADHPKDFTALVAAGKAALQLGDTQAAAGFFGRAEEVNANSPLPKVGMGAALVATGDPNGALTYFARAQQLGATATTLGCDRGLAYDLLGKQVAAQTDYRAALAGPDRAEARRRLALSLAISGNKTLAVSTLQPLLQRRDVAAQRVLALVLALDGDLDGAKAALDFTMPGASARMDPFFRRLPALPNVQKAAAVHLGIFPESGVAVAAAPREDRLASIEQLLVPRPQAQPTVQAPTAYSPPPPVVRNRPAVQTASLPEHRATAALRSPNNELVQTAKVASEPGRSKIWLQLASGTNASDLPDEFRKIRSRKPSLFTGLNGFVANTDSRARLLIGPFHSRKDASLFAEALWSESIRSFPWRSAPGQVVRELPSQ